MTTDNNTGTMNDALRAVAAEGSSSSGVFTFGADADTATDTDNGGTMSDALRALSTGGTFAPSVTIGAPEEPEDDAPKSRPAQSSAEMSAWLRGEARRQSVL